MSIMNETKKEIASRLNVSEYMNDMYYQLVENLNDKFKLKVDIATDLSDTELREFFCKMCEVKELLDFLNENYTECNYQKHKLELENKRLLEENKKLLEDIKNKKNMIEDSSDSEEEDNECCCGYCVGEEEEEPPKKIIKKVVRRVVKK